MEPLEPLEPDLPPAPKPRHEERCPVTGVEVLQVMVALSQIQKWEEQRERREIDEPTLFQRVEDLQGEAILREALNANVEDTGGMHPLVGTLRAAVKQILR